MQREYAEIEPQQFAIAQHGPEQSRDRLGIAMHANALRHWYHEFGDDTGTVVIRKRISRAKVLEFFGNLSSCLVGIEACPSAHL